jgi:hypothetical protein
VKVREARLEVGRRRKLEAARKVQPEGRLEGASWKIGAKAGWKIKTRCKLRTGWKAATESKLSMRVGRLNWMAEPEDGQRRESRADPKGEAERLSEGASWSAAGR